jgi:hypothetical protein
MNYEMFLMLYLKFRETRARLVRKNYAKERQKNTVGAQKTGVHQGA